MARRYRVVADFGGGQDPASRVCEGAASVLELMRELRQSGVRFHVWNPGRPRTPEEVLRRYPRLIAHLICESLGYYTPGHAANTVMAYQAGLSWGGEWHDHLAQGRLGRKGRRPTSEEYDEEMRRINHVVIRWAFERRHTHRGAMAHYPQARAIVDGVNQGCKPPMLASWF